MTGAIYALACRFSQALTAFNRHPVAILLFVPACLLVVALGWLVDRTEAAVWGLTLVLSVDASLETRMMLLKQARSDGEVD